MRTDTENLISGLVDELQPVRPLRFWRGLGLALAAMALTVIMVVTLGGVRPDLAAGRPDAMFLIASGLFLLLGLAAAVTVVVMGSPRVGNSHDGWRWAAAMAGLLPLAALLLALGDFHAAWIASEPEHGLLCTVYSLGLGLLTGAMLVLWLRRGAPTSPGYAGLLTGIAAGCAGVFAFSFACPFDSIMHIGLWHGLAVAVSAFAGWLIVPRLVRW
ncbi:MAG: DUF1109 domain-containing protein [Novosphingobium sp.]|nr:DUF1109 domain-containing protein [Novosphingobium sp.]